eukprot:Gb_12182 [translate_table: standard]
MVGNQPGMQKICPLSKIPMKIALPAATTPKLQGILLQIAQVDTKTPPLAAAPMHQENSALLLLSSHTNFSKMHGKCSRAPPPHLRILHSKPTPSTHQPLLQKRCPFKGDETRWRTKGEACKGGHASS